MHDAFDYLSGTAIGLYSVLVALILLFRGGRTIERTMGDQIFVLFAGIVSFAMGQAIVLGHNLWSGGALTVTVTVLGWYILFKGVMLLAITPAQLDRWVTAMNHGRYYPLYLLPAFVIGAYLTWAGFSARSQ